MAEGRREHNRETVLVVLGILACIAAFFYWLAQPGVVEELGRQEGMREAARAPDR